MLLLISPAKKLNLDNPNPNIKFTQPEFIYETQVLVDILRNFSPQQLADLMKISDQIASLNLARYSNFSTKFSLKNAKQAAFAFAGDTYKGLSPNDFTDDDCNFMQQHLRILSGLYGVLRPLDLLQPYRLEMGTRLKNPAGNDLYAYWQKIITHKLNQILEELKTNLVVNLASNEYFKVVDSKSLQANIINCDFKDFNQGKYKTIGIHAKRARGAMARFIIKNKITEPERLIEFGYDDYRFCATDSSQYKLVFLRG